METAFVTLSNPVRFVLRKQGHESSLVCLRASQRAKAWSPGSARPIVVACSSEKSDSSLDEYDPMNLLEQPLKWREIPFGSLQEELDAIDDYVKEEEIQESDAWPRYLRGAAYEHWGQPALALAQYDTCYNSRGLRLVPEFWLRKAYNAFKTEQVAKAEIYHEKAREISINAVGNQLHFSFWFENNFKEFMPKHNGPSYSLQRGICLYTAGKMEMARTTLVPFMLHVTNTIGDVDHGAMWFLAASRRARKTTELNASVDKDVSLVSKILASPTLNPALEPLVPLFLGNADHLEVAKNAAMEDMQDGDTAMIRALYLALYFDAYTDDADSREEWLDRALAAPKNVSPASVSDFLYYAAKNRLTVGPNETKDL
jgi:hypothetical protein